MPKTKPALFNGEEVLVKKGIHPNGLVRLLLIDAHDHMPVANCTLSVEDRRLDIPNHVVIKNYSENIGVLECLQEAGIVGEVEFRISVGLAFGDVVPLLWK